MKIQVKIIGPYIYDAGFSEKEFEVPNPTTAAQLLALIKLKPGRPRIVTRNGTAVSPDDELRDGDRVVVSPLYSGG